MAIFSEFSNSVAETEMVVGNLWLSGAGLPASTSRVAMANRALTDMPHISTPITLSIGPKIRHTFGRTMSPYPTVE
jgi:hypothetical protein